MGMSYILDDSHLQFMTCFGSEGLNFLWDFGRNLMKDPMEPPFFRGYWDVLLVLS